MSPFLGLVGSLKTHHFFLVKSCDFLASSVNINCHFCLTALSTNSPFFHNEIYQFSWRSFEILFVDLCHPTAPIAKEQSPNNVTAKNISKLKYVIVEKFFTVTSITFTPRYLTQLIYVSKLGPFPASFFFISSYQYSLFNTVDSM